MLANCPNRNRVLCLSKIGKQKFLSVVYSDRCHLMAMNHCVRLFFYVYANIGKSIALVGSFYYFARKKRSF
jgi:hypothetical protein